MVERGLVVAGADSVVLAVGRPTSRLAGCSHTSVRVVVYGWSDKGSRGMLNHLGVRIVGGGEIGSGIGRVR